MTESIYKKKPMNVKFIGFSILQLILNNYFSFKSKFYIFRMVLRTLLDI